MAPDFIERFNKADSFPLDTISDFEDFRKKDVYKTIVKESEDEDTFGNKGCFEMKPDFTMVFLSTFQDEEIAQEVIRNIPKSNEMVILKVV